MLAKPWTDWLMSRRFPADLEPADLFKSFGLENWPAGWSGEFPKIEVSEDEKTVFVKAETPGMDAKDFEVNVAGEFLTVSGEKKEEKEEKGKNLRYTERKYGRFERTVQLPCEVDSGRVEAHYRNGVLEVKLAKSGNGKARKVEVKA
jgi:HSP20 family protein